MVSCKTANKAIRLVVTLVFATAAATLSSCEAGMDTGATPELSAAMQCNSNSACGDGQLCDPHYKLCVSETSEEQELALIATPPAQLEAVPAHLSGVWITPGEHLTVDLPPTVKLRGRIAVDGNLLEPSSITATVLAVALEQVVPSLYRATSTIADSNGFELNLEAGVEYHLFIRADDRSRPTHVTTAELEADQDLTITLPALETLPSLRGRVLQSEEGMNRPLQGIAVTAVEAETKVRCSSGTTDEYGAYTVTCPGDGTYIVRMGPTPDSAPVPRFDAKFDGVSEVLVNSALELPPLILPIQSRTSPLNIEVNGFATGASPGLEGVDITLSAEIDDTPVWRNAIFSVQAVTDQGGDINLDVVPGQYTLEVIPSSMSAYGAVEDELAVGDNPVSKQITLDLKPTLRGAITSKDGSPVARAQVEAKMAITDPITGAKGTRSYSVHANDDGLYELPVDIGVVSLDVFPPDGSGLPSWRQDSVEVLTDSEVNVMLPGAQVVTGTVMAADNTDAAGVAIDIFLPEGNTVRHIARGYSDAQGQFLIVLPEP